MLEKLTSRTPPTFLTRKMRAYPRSPKKTQRSLVRIFDRLSVNLMPKPPSRKSLKYKNIFSNHHIFETKWCKPVVFNRIYSLKHQRFTTLGSKDIEIRKSEFVAKISPFPWNITTYKLNQEARKKVEFEVIMK